MHVTGVSSGAFLRHLYGITMALVLDSVFVATIYTLEVVIIAVEVIWRCAMLRIWSSGQHVKRY
jgi:hypothetical protein